MKIAVAYENGNVFQHFGHTEQFKVYTVEDGKIENEEIISAEGSGHSALAVVLANNKIDALICGGIGGGARTALEERGITLYGGVTGNADCAVSALLEGKLTYNPDVKCSHHEHEHGGSEHKCGEHGCGKHECR